MIVVLSGGVGAARLLTALSDVTDPRDTTAIVNVGDDVVVHGLMVCPDLDTITYTLANVHDAAQGWGRADESWRVMTELEALGGEAWFRLGDRDLATHLYRTDRLAAGATKSEVTADLAARRDVRERVLPVTNERLETRFDTADGELSFQEYFVQHHHNVPVSAVKFAGASECHPAPGVLEAIATAERIVVAPSNPLISVAPILAVPGVREAVAARRADVVAVSPIVSGAALKGPADRLLRELGHEVSCTGVARFYAGLIGTMVIDETDAACQRDIESLGVAVRVTTTVMANPDHARALAKAALL